MSEDAEKMQEKNVSINTAIKEQTQKEAKVSSVDQVRNTGAETIRKVKEETYTIKDLINNCKAIGYRKEVAAGALFNCGKTEMTKAEFANTIKIFLGKKVK